MKVWTLWYGGASYSAPSVYREEDIEEFDSIKSAKWAFEARAGYDPYYPCIDDSSEMHVFFKNPFNVKEYPDGIIYLGPRGGTIWERC